MSFVDTLRVPPAFKAPIYFLDVGTDPETLESSPDDRVGYRGNHGRPNFRSPAKSCIPAQSMYDARLTTEKRYASPTRTIVKQSACTRAGRLLIARRPVARM